MHSQGHPGKWKYWQTLHVWKREHEHFCTSENFPFQWFWSLRGSRVSEESGKDTEEKQGNQLYHTLLDVYHNHLTHQMKIEIHPPSGRAETFCNVQRQQIPKSVMFWSVQLLLTHITWKRVVWRTSTKKEDNLTWYWTICHCHINTSLTRLTWSV